MSTERRPIIALKIGVANLLIFHAKLRFTCVSPGIFMPSHLSVMLAALLCSASATVTAADTRDEFMATLHGLCGERFEGGLTYAIDPKNPYAGQKMSTEIICTGADVRLPVQVGEDRSRTWIFTRSGAGLDLRHDHRHPDGTPEAVTMYGGLANDAGSALSQSFLADAVTFKLFPGSETNVWTTSFSPDGSVLTYHLDRYAKPRIEFVLRRVGRQATVGVVMQPIWVTENAGVFGTAWRGS